MQTTQPVAGPSDSGPSSSTAGKPDRLFVGNLAPTVDEYALLQIFSKYGKITKLDFMFHKSGVLKGKPKGYAFMEFSNKDDALKAMVKLHDRLLRGRKLVVTYANSAPISDLPFPTKGRRHTETPKTTTLSLLKSRRHPQSTAAQIAAMEAKLASMAKKKPADEDYIPGSSIYPLGSGSRTASPVVDEDMDHALGAEEGGRAADDLERELMEEIGDAVKVEEEEVKPSMTQDASRSPDRVGSSSRDIVESTEVEIAPRLHLPPQSILPPRPNFSSPVPETRTIPSLEPSRNPVKTKEESFKRGLAGLPKKPAF